MHIEEIEATGFRGLSGVHRLRPLETLALAWEARRALRHAMHLPFALSDASLLLSLLGEWGAADPVFASESGVVNV